MSGRRHSVQRSHRVQLKADAVVLLDRIAALMTSEPQYIGTTNKLRLEIAEMRIRLAPPPGLETPIVRTGYTGRK